MADHDVVFEIRADSSELAGDLNKAEKVIVSSAEKTAEKRVSFEKKYSEIVKKENKEIQKSNKETEEQAENTSDKTTEKVKENSKEQEKTVRELLRDILSEVKKSSETTREESEKTSEKVKDDSEAMGESVKTNMAAVATAIGAAFAAAGAAVGAMAVKGAVDVDRAMQQYTAATGAAADETERMETVLKDIYANNYGESFGDIADTMVIIRQQMGNLADDEMQSAAEGALALRDTFGYEVSESIRSAETLMKNFGISSTEAYNLIVQGAQNGLDYSGELLDTVNEYSSQFKKSGIDAEGMFSILANGAEKGAWNLDKIGDAIKENAIRAIDGSTTTAEGFAALGLDAEKMAQKFTEGGDSAAEALELTLYKLNLMQDKVAQDAAGVALFGTQWEDLGASVVLSLSTANDKIDMTKNSLEELQSVKYNDLGSMFEGFTRTIELLLIPLGEDLIPMLGDLIEAGKPIVEEVIPELTENLSPLITQLSGLIAPLAQLVTELLPPLMGLITPIVAVSADIAEQVFPKLSNILSKLIPKLTELIEKLLPHVEKLLDIILPLLDVFGTVLGTIVGVATKFSDVIVVATAALVAYKAAMAIAGIISSVTTALNGATVAQYALNLAMSLNPVGLLVASIGGLIAELGLLFNSLNSCSEEVRKMSDEQKRLQDSIDDAVSSNEAEMTMLKTKADRYEELRTKIKRTVAEENELKNLAADLQSVLGNECTVVNSLTGEYANLSAEIENYITKKNQQIRLSAYESATKDSYVAIGEIDRKISEKNKRMREIDVGGINVIEQYEYVGLANDIKELENTKQGYQATIDEYNNLLTQQMQRDSNSVADNPVSTPEADDSNDIDPLSGDKTQNLSDELAAPTDGGGSGGSGSTKSDVPFTTAKKDLDYRRNMGMITNTQYYAEYAALRDKYLTPDSDEWRNANVDIHRGEEALKKSSEAVTKSTSKSTTTAGAASENKGNTISITSYVPTIWDNAEESEKKLKKGIGAQLTGNLRSGSSMIINGLEDVRSDISAGVTATASASEAAGATLSDVVKAVKELKASNDKIKCSLDLEVVARDLVVGKVAVNDINEITRKNGKTPLEGV